MDIYFYETEDGTKPAQVFLDSLDPKMLAKMLRTIDLLKNNGIALRRPYSALFEDGIYELRAQQGSNISRVLYFFQMGDKAYLTNGFIKKTQKTPRQEIELAKKYREDHMRRHPNE